MHTEHIEGWKGTNNELIKAIGNLKYDSMAALFYGLSNELENQSIADFKKGKTKLATVLRRVADELFNVQSDLAKAWIICKPYMDKKKGAL